MSDQERSYTRAEVYELAWSRPLKALSSVFLLSGRGIAKVCAVHDIPVPGRGYWQKIDAGQKVEREPLPENAARSADQVVFTDHEIARRRGGASGGTTRTARIVRRRPAKKVEPVKWTRLVIPERPVWTGPAKTRLSALVTISEWSWAYSFHAMPPDPSDGPFFAPSTKDPYLETHSLFLSGTIAKPKRRAGTRVRMELKPFRMLDARDDGEVRATPTGEWWSERGTVVGHALIPNHAAAPIIGALAAGKVAYMTVSAAGIGGRGGVEIYGVSLSATCDPDDWA